MTLALILSPGPTRLPDSAHEASGQSSQGPKDRETESIKGKEW